jgi:hypothetical protein
VEIFDAFEFIVVSAREHDFWSSRVENEEILL